MTGKQLQNRESDSRNLTANDADNKSPYRSQLTRTSQNDRTQV